MQVKDVMTRGVEVIRSDATLADAAAMMKSLDVGPLPVVDDGRLVGIVTDRDIMVRTTAQGRDPAQSTVREAMSSNVVYCFEDQDVRDAARLMQEHQVRRLVVVNRDRQLVGLVSIGDLAMNTDDKLAGQVLERVAVPGEPPISVGSVGEGRSEARAGTAGASAKTVAGLFADRGRAQQAIDDLRKAGVDLRRLSVITQDPERGREVAGSSGAKVAAGAAGGVGLGAILGAAAGFLVGIGALAIPGIGPVVAAGPLAAALGVAGTTAAAGAGVGAVAGGLIGALTGLGFSEAEAREYESRVKRGDILLAAEVQDGLAERAEAILRRNVADRVTTRQGKPADQQGQQGRQDEGDRQQRSAGRR